MHPRVEVAFEKEKRGRKKESKPIKTPFLIQQEYEVTLSEMMEIMEIRLHLIQMSTCNM